MNNCQCFSTSDSVSMQNRRCFWRVVFFFLPHRSRRSINIMNNNNKKKHWINLNN